MPPRKGVSSSLLLSGDGLFLFSITALHRLCNYLASYRPLHRGDSLRINKTMTVPRRFETHTASQLDVLMLFRSSLASLSSRGRRWFDFGPSWICLSS